MDTERQVGHTVHVQDKSRLRCLLHIQGLFREAFDIRRMKNKATLQVHLFVFYKLKTLQST